ncbi:MAG: tyrosine-type recombinase/integrase [Verrucomicrobiae bacterium]|nr:tyrosine-type recombinase/integrase [Verrucomicrobiae bacterium]
MKPKTNRVAMKCVGENLWLRHGRYYARLKKSGKDIWKSLRTVDRNIAAARLLDVKAKISSHTPDPAKGKIPTLANACDVLLERAKLEVKRPRTLETLRSSLNCLKESTLGSLQINRIVINHIKEHVLDRAAQFSGRTANHDLTALRKVFKLAVEKGWRWDDPSREIAQLPHKEKKVPVPSLEEIKLVLLAMRDGRMRFEAQKAAVFIELLALSGLRRAEAQALAWEDVDFEKGLLIVRDGKGGKPRIVDLFPSLRAFMERLLGGHGESTGLIFPRKGAQPYNPKRALETACKIAGVPRFSFHGLRHAWATELVKAGIDFGTIAKWAGHNDGGLLIAKRYGNHMRRDHMQMAAQKATFSVS